MEVMGRFRAGERVGLLRDLAGLRARTEGAIRGIRADAGGISYAIRFEKSTRIVAERDLGPSQERCT
jgi:hypothetical protein